jgi:hypothetical protein
MFIKQSPLRFAGNPSSEGEITLSSENEIVISVLVKGESQAQA